MTDAIETAINDSIDAAVDEGVMTEDATPETGETQVASAAADEPANEPATGADDEAVTPDARGRLPYRRHEAILNNERAKHAAELAARDEKYAQYATPDWQAKSQLLQIIEQEPERAFEILKAVDPRYAKLFGAAQPAQEQARPAPGKQAPAPDVQLPDGSVGYSEDGLRSLLDWQAAQTEERVSKKFEERFGPIAEAHERTEQIRAIVPKIQAQIADANTWPGFTDNQPAILAVLKGDRSVSLEAAYRKVVFPRLQADRNTMRAELMAEINRKPKAASAMAPGASSSSSNGGSRDMTDVINDAISGLE